MNRMIYTLSKREDQSVLNILSVDFENKGLNPSGLNPATGNRQSTIHATSNETSSSSDIPALSTVSNPHPSNRDGQESSEDDYSPSAASANSMVEELSSDSDSWQGGPGFCEKEEKSKGPLK